MRTSERSRGSGIRLSARRQANKRLEQTLHVLIINAFRSWALLISVHVVHKTRPIQWTQRELAKSCKLHGIIRYLSADLETYRTQSPEKGLMTMFSGFVNEHPDIQCPPCLSVYSIKRYRFYTHIFFYCFAIRVWWEYSRMATPDWFAQGFQSADLAWWFRQRKDRTLVAISATFFRTSDCGSRHWTSCPRMA